MLVDALAADLELDAADEVVTDPVEPAELRARAVRRLEGDRRERGLEVDAVDQITVALDRARYTLAEARGAVERVLDGLHGEVGVATVNYLEECDLRITCEVNVLGTISDELHKTTTCHLVYTCWKEKILKKCRNGGKKKLFHNLQKSYKIPANREPV